MVLGMPAHPDIVVHAWTNKRLREEHQLPQADAGQAWPGASVPAIYGGPGSMDGLPVIRSRSPQAIA